MNIGGRLKQLRQERSLSQWDLARLSGVAQSNISLIEANRVSPSIETLSRLAEALNVPLADLVSEPRAKTG
jgi:transcriptional regulator with XRE-family HTH domain